VYVFGFLVSDIIVHYIYIQSCGSYKVSSTPEMFVSGSGSSGGMLVIESDSGLSFESPHHRRNRY
jgi:hypothetical protein